MKRKADPQLRDELAMIVSRVSAEMAERAERKRELMGQVPEIVARGVEKLNQQRGEHGKSKRARD